MNRGAQKGMSLLELMAALASFSVISGAAYMFFHRSELSATIRDASAEAELKARDVVDRLSVELRQSGLTCPDWSFSAASVTFNKAIGFDGDNVVWSPAITYDLDAALGETLNNVDDNGNNLVDECYLRRVEDQTAPPPWTGYTPGPPTQTYGGLIEAGDLVMTVNENLITIDVAVSHWSSLAQTVIVGRQITAVALRN